MTNEMLYKVRNNVSIVAVPGERISPEAAGRLNPGIYIPDNGRFIQAKRVDSVETVPLPGNAGHMATGKTVTEYVPLSFNERLSERLKSALRRA